MSRKNIPSVEEIFMRISRKLSPTIIYPAGALILFLSTVRAKQFPDLDPDICIAALAIDVLTSARAFAIAADESGLIESPVPRAKRLREDMAGVAEILRDAADLIELAVLPAATPTTASEDD